MNYLESEGTEAERYFVVLRGARPAVYITVFHGEDVDFLATSVIRGLNVVMVLEPPVNWENRSCRDEQGS